MNRLKNILPYRNLKNSIANSNLGFSRAIARHIWFPIFFLIFCNKLPIGEDELNLRGNFKSQSIELPLYASLTEYKNIPLGSSANLILAKGNGYESRILLKFNFPDTAYQGLDEIKLLLFRNNIFYKDTIKFSVHLLTNSFTETEANWYKRSNTEPWDSGGGDFEKNSLKFGEITGDSVLVRFNYIELNKIKAAKGLIIIPEDSGFSGFYSREGGTAPSFQLVKNGVVTSISIGADCHILTGPERFYIENWLGSGMAYRNFVMFSYDTTLNEKKAIYGELTFRQENHLGMRDSVEIGIKELLEPLKGFDSNLGPLIALTKFSIKDTLFKIDIVHYVQRIIEHPDSNFGFFIYLSPENYDITAIKLVHGSHHLKVGYISPPGER